MKDELQIGAERREWLEVFARSVFMANLGCFFLFFGLLSDRPFGDYIFRWIFSRIAATPRNGESFAAVSL